MIVLKVLKICKTLCKICKRVCSLQISNIKLLLQGISIVIYFSFGVCTVWYLVYIYCIHCVPYQLWPASPASFSLAFSHFSYVCQLVNKNKFLTLPSASQIADNNNNKKRKNSRRSCCCFCCSRCCCCCCNSCGVDDIRRSTSAGLAMSNMKNNNNKTEKQRRREGKQGVNKGRRR